MDNSIHGDFIEPGDVPFQGAINWFFVTFVKNIFQFLIITLCFLSLNVTAQPENEQLTAIRAGHLLDVKSGKLIKDTVILVRGDRIEAVGPEVTIPADAVQVNLSNYVVLPGLIDAHTHICLQPDYPLKNPILYKSIPYRTAEAVAAARASLEAGFTTLRDIDSEGAEWADVAVRDAINAGVVPGPRMQVATLAISITGGYMNQNGLAPQIEVTQFGELVDSPAALIHEVRRQIKYGADWIKIYATGTTTHIDLNNMEPLAQFEYDDIALVVKEASRFRKPVAAHAYGGQAAKDAIRAGVRSIEHGMLLDDEALDLMVKRGTFWVPTLSVYMPSGPRDQWDERSKAIVASHKQVFKKAVKKGVKIAYGTDAGAIAHGNNAIDLTVMVDYGMSPIRTIQSATTVASNLMGLADDIGSLEPGKYADLIAVSANPLKDISTLQSVRFVMKGGHIYKDIKR